ncbi:MAG TPA: uroporphyrinogen decarboxylase [Thermomicrobiales bacterium]|nr:uroporphyrinogen decarboxylase [Thermomicrobiales bacterium]
MAAEVAAMTGRERFLAALRREQPDCTPVWFMRQAGRCLPEYRELRKKHSFLEVARTPELATEATLMPIDRFNVDGAVLFADIILPLEGMGVPFEIRPGVGPVIEEPVRSTAAVDALRVVEPEEGTSYVLDALRMLKGELGQRAALLGFAGAPFTLACYLIEGRPTKEYPITKGLMYGEPELWHRIMETLTEVTIRYLQGQARAGADVVQLFDSWLGLLDEASFREYVQPYTARIFEAMGGVVPTVHFSTGTVQLLEAIGETGPGVVSVDWRLPIDVAWEQLGHRTGIQGNLDPARLMASWDIIEQGADDILHRVHGRAGHVFNLGHGVNPATDPDKLTRLVDHIHTASAR